MCEQGEDIATTIAIDAVTLQTLPSLTLYREPSLGAIGKISFPLGSRPC